MKNNFPFLLVAALATSLLHTLSEATTRAERAAEYAAANPDLGWHQLMDTGPFIADTFLEFSREGNTAALKGVAIKIGPNEQSSVVFDTELLRMTSGFDGKATLAGTAWDGKHHGNSYLPDERSVYFFFNETSPGWAIEGDWSDPRPTQNGPLPRERGRYKGLYRHGEKVILTYTIGETTVFESASANDASLTRSFELGPTKKSLQLLVSDPIPTKSPNTVLPQISHKLQGAPKGAKIETMPNGRVIVTLPPSKKASRFDLVYLRAGAELPPFNKQKLSSFTKGGPGIYPETIETVGQAGEDQSPYTVDTLPLPLDNPWHSNIRFGAFDFFADGDRAACSSWNGDVWIATGLKGDLNSIKWKRYASGLYQTLGLKIIDGVVYTQGRDQITRLHDLNNDGEADFYECFNNDVLITTGFHEFSFDLVTDKEGNFYFSKGMPVLGGGRGFAPWTEHNGSILKVSKDGSQLERYAWGLRAPGGIGVGPNGEITTGENEGSYVPRCKITWSKPDSFHGVVPSVWENKKFVETLPGAPTDYERPLTWLPYNVDNSSGSQVWVPENSSWGPLHRNEMLHFSYGKSSIFRVLKDEVNGQVQGGVYKLPIDLSIPAQRGKFHPKSGDLYVMGLRGWQTNGGTGFQRVRYTGETTPAPIGMQVHDNGILIQFSDTLNQTEAEDVRRYTLKKWNYVWGPQYGSGRFSIDRRDAALEEKALRSPSKGVVNNVDTVSVRAAKLQPNGKSVFLYIPKMTPAMQMEIKMDIASASGTAFRETIWNTVHNLHPSFEKHGLDLDNLPKINTAPRGNPGLTMTMAYEAADDATIVDRVAFNVPAKTPITPFMRTNKTFETVFEGSLVIEERDKIAFRIEGHGTAMLQIGGQEILSGTLPLESDPISLETGGHALLATYQSAKVSEGRMQLLWSGENFRWEPVPPSAFLHVSTKLIGDRTKAREGRKIFAAAQCIQCHTPTGKSWDPIKAMPELSETLPDFQNIGSRLNQSWLEQWTQNPSAYCPPVASEDAADVAAYLASRTTSFASPKPGDATAGETLVEQLHFTHWADALSKEAKHTDSGLYAFLKNPAQHHPDTTFPDLRLSDEETADISAYILGKRPDAPAPKKGDAKRGQEIVSQSCLVCHGQDGESYQYAAPTLEKMWNADWATQGCLSGNNERSPRLDLDTEEKQNLIAFNNTTINAIYNWTPREYAERTIERLNCLQCHSDDNGLPSIEQAGSKLDTHWLQSLFEGKADPVRPWIDARMPSFASRAKHLATALAARDGAPFEPEEKSGADELLAAGETLSGFQGYACITCHAVGDTAALQAFEGQGPNLHTAAERLRYDYYQSWMHWPQRKVPTTIMPKYASDKENALNTTLLEGSSEKQFEALWHWMQSIEREKK